MILGGLRYTYYVRAYDLAGRPSPPSNCVTIEPEIPGFDAAAKALPA